MCIAKCKGELTRWLIQQTDLRKTDRRGSPHYEKQIDTLEPVPKPVSRTFTGICNRPRARPTGAAYRDRPERTSFGGSAALLGLAVRLLREGGLLGARHP